MPHLSVQGNFVDNGSKNKNKRKKKLDGFTPDPTRELSSAKQLNTAPTYKTTRLEQGLRAVHSTSVVSLALLLFWIKTHRDL